MLKVWIVDDVMCHSIIVLIIWFKKRVNNLNINVNQTLKTHAFWIYIRKTGYGQVENTQAKTPIVLPYPLKRNTSATHKNKHIYFCTVTFSGFKFLKNKFCQTKPGYELNIVLYVFTYILYTHVQDIRESW